MAINKVILVGNLGGDPEVRFMTNGEAVANFSLATTDRWKDKNTGENKDYTEWHRIVMYGKRAEVAGKYLKKGSQVYLEGKLKTNKWTDNQGVERYTTNVQCDLLKMLGKKDSESDLGGDNYKKPQQKQQSQASSFSDDEVPF